jgi:predicted nucleotidyltransferase
MRVKPYIEQIKDMVLDFFKNEKTSVYLFGSRARGDHKVYSDVDIGLIPEAELSRKKISQLLEIFENSAIPYKVEIINLEETTDDFRKQAMRDAVVWKD